MSGIPLPREAAVGTWWARRRPSALAAGRRARSELPQLATHERVLVRESAADGAEYVGTNTALYHRPAPPGDRDWQHLGWTDVATVDWSRATRTVTLRPFAPATFPVLPVQVKAGSRLPDFAAERVTACRIASLRVLIDGRLGATVTAEHGPAGGVAWRVRLDDGTDPADPAIAPAIAATLAALRAQLGC
jgi:hypothetical protein